MLAVELGPAFEAQLNTLLLWDGLGLPDQTRNRLQREWVKVKALTRQIREVQRERRVLLRTSSDPAIDVFWKVTGVTNVNVRVARRVGDAIENTLVPAEPDPTAAMSAS